MDTNSPAPIGCYIGGYMEKKGGSQGGRKNWQKRYFVLTNDQVIYYTPKGDMKGFIAVDKIISVDQPENNKRPNLFTLVVDTSEDKKAKGDTRELEIDALNAEKKGEWVFACETLVKVYKNVKNLNMYDQFQSTLCEKTMNFLEASSAFFLNSFEFLRRVVNNEAKSEFSDMIKELPRLSVKLLSDLSAATRDGSYPAVNRAFETISEIDREISSAIGHWSRLPRSSTGYGPEVDQVPATLEGLEQSVNSARNPILDFVNEHMKKQKEKENEEAERAEQLEKQKEEQEKMRLAEEEEYKRILAEQEAEAAALAKQFEGRELDKEIYELTNNMDDLAIDDPNSAILSALMDF